MADLPIWLAGIGTTGTLVSGVYLTQQDRQDRKRSLISPVRCSISLGRVDPSTLTLTVRNPTPDPVYDLAYYVIAKVTLASGETKSLGCRFWMTEFGAPWRFEFDILQGVRSVDVGPESASTSITTDIAGRTWLKRRRRGYQQKTLFTRWKIDRQIAHLEERWSEQEVTVDVDWQEGRWVALDSQTERAMELTGLEPVTYALPARRSSS
jgi:hypothetical protein